VERGREPRRSARRDHQSDYGPAQLSQWRRAWALGQIATDRGALNQSPIPGCRFVGITADTRDDGLRNPVKPAIYIPNTLFMSEYTQVLLRTSVTAAPLQHRYDRLIVFLTSSSGPPPVAGLLVNVQPDRLHTGHEEPPWMSLNQPLLLSSALVHQALLDPATYPSKQVPKRRDRPVRQFQSQRQLRRTPRQDSRGPSTGG
jgi:hypothetical protein